MVNFSVLVLDFAAADVGDGCLLWWLPFFWEIIPVVPMFSVYFDIVSAEVMKSISYTLNPGSWNLVLFGLVRGAGACVGDGSEMEGAFERGFFWRV